MVKNLVLIGDVEKVCVIKSLSADIAPFWQKESTCGRNMTVSAELLNSILFLSNLDFWK